MFRRPAPDHEDRSDGQDGNRLGSNHMGHETALGERRSHEQHSQTEAHRAPEHEPEKGGTPGEESGPEEDQEQHVAAPACRTQEGDDDIPRVGHRPLVGPHRQLDTGTRPHTAGSRTHPLVTFPYRNQNSQYPEKGQEPPGARGHSLSRWGSPGLRCRARPISGILFTGLSGLRGYVTPCRAADARSAAAPTMWAAGAAPRPRAGT